MMRFKRVRFVIVAFAVACAIALLTFRSEFVSEATKTSGFVPVIGATKSVTDVAGTVDGNADPGDTLEYTVVINNTGPDPATGVVMNDTIQNITTFVPGSTIASPIAVNDSFASIGNVGITVPLSNGLLANDLDPNNPGVGTALVIVSPPTTSVNGGNLSINATTGAFTYNPAPGFTGNDSFTYTLGNGTGLTNTATVSLTVTGLIWFIDNSAASNGNGRLGTPFNSLANFNSGAADEAGDNIFLYRQVATNYTGGITLLANQKLIGQGATTTLAAITGLTVPTFSNALPAVGGTRPTLTHSANNVVLSPGNTLRGLNIQSTGGSTLSGTNFNGLTALENTVSATGGTAAVNLDQTTGIAAINVTFISVAASGSANGIRLFDTSGSFTVTGDGGGTSNGSGGIIQNSTGIGVNLNNTSNVSLGYMNIQTSADAGIKGISVTNFALNRSNVTSNGNSTSDEGIQFGEFTGNTVGVTGTVSITNSNVSGNAHNNVHFRSTSGTTDLLTVTNSTFNDLNDTFGANSFLYEASGTSVTTAANLTGCTFTNNSPQRALEVQTHDTGRIGALNGSTTFTVSNSSFTNNGIHASFTQDTASNLAFKFLNNGSVAVPMDAVSSTLSAVNIFSSSTSTGGTIVGTVSGNQINMGAINALGVRAVIQGRTDATLLIDSNTAVNNTSGNRCIAVSFLGPTANTGGVPVSDVTITNNVANNTTGQAFPLASISVEADNQSSAFASAPTVRADIRGNTVPATPAFDLTSGHLQFYEYDGDATPNEFQDGIGQLVDTGAASPTATAQLQSTNTGSSEAVGVALIAGPISVPSFAEMDENAATASTRDLDRMSLMEPAYRQEVITRETVDTQAYGTAVYSRISALLGTIATMILPTVTAQKATPAEVIPESGEMVTKALGTIPAGESVTVRFRVTVDNGPYASGVNTITNTAAISGNFTTVNTNTSSIILDAAPDLVVTKTEGGTTTQPSGTIVYTLTYSNPTATNGQNAVNVVLTEMVPFNSTFNAAASLPSVWSCPDGSVGGTNCTINIGNLNAGAAAGTATFAVNVPALLLPGTIMIFNSSDIAENPVVNGADRMPANNNGTDTTPIVGNWLGTASTNWHTATNWSNAIVPPAGNNISIPNSNVAPTITTQDVSVNDLMLNRNMTIAAGRTLTAAGNVSIGGVLVLGPGTLALGPLAPQISRTTGQVNTTLQKTFSAAGPFVFPVGTIGRYSPVNVVVNSGTGTLSVTANTGTVPATSPPNPATTLQRYWTLNGSGIMADVTFNYVTSDVVGNENNYRIMRVRDGNKISLANGSPCPGSGSPCVDPAANTIFVRNLSVFSDWTASELAPTAANASVTGRVLTPEGDGAMRSVVSMTDPNGNTVYATANHFGYFRFVNIPVGQNYVLAVVSKRYIYAPQTITIVDDIAGLEIIPKTEQ